MGTGSIFDVLRLNFLTFLGKEVLSGYLRGVQHGFSTGTGNRIVRGGRKIQLRYKQCAS